MESRSDDRLTGILERLRRPKRQGRMTPGLTGVELTLDHALLELLPAERRAAEITRRLVEQESLASDQIPNRPHLTEFKPLALTTARELMQRTPEDPHRAAALPLGLLQAQYRLELAAVSALAPNDLTTDLLGEYLEAALDTLFELLLCYWRHQLPPQELLWNEAHALYQVACHAGLDTLGSPQQTSTARQLRAAYLKPLLLGSLNPTRYRPVEIRQIAAFLDRHVDCARLGGEDGLLCIELDSSRPPGYLRRQAPANCVRLCVRGLVQRLDQQTAEALPTPRLARDMGRYWTRRQVRSELHRRTDEQVTVVVGLDVIHQLLTGCNDDDLFPNQLQLREPSPTQVGRYTTAFPAACIDSSDGGARLRLDAGTADTASPGALVAVFSTATLSPRLGIVRWAQVSKDFRLLAGLRWLPTNQQPCALRNLDSPLSMAFMRAFWNPGGAGDEAELIAPTGIYRTGDSVQVRTAEGEFETFITTAMDTTFHVTLFRTRLQKMAADLDAQPPAPRDAGGSGASQAPARPVE